jgi:hypothetical protein
MSTVVKAIVMWLIALSIPLQGMAAVVMPMCPPAHHSGSTGDSEGLTQHHEVDCETAASADHTMHQGTASPHTAASSPEDSAAGHSGHGMLKCCSASGSMAAVMAPELALRAPASSPAPLQRVVQFYRSVTPDGLDRPPKFVRT